MSAAQAVDDPSRGGRSDGHGLLLILGEVIVGFKSLQHFESVLGITVLALGECQDPPQERLERSRSKRSCR